MSKRSRKPKISKPNLPRSKNNPSGKRNDPDVNWPKYNDGRKPEGHNYAKRMPKLAGRMREALGIPEGEKDRRVSAMLASLVKSEEGLSHWGLVRRFAKHPGDLERRGLGRPHGKSRYRLRISEMDPAILNKLILWMAGDDAARGTKIVDSTGFSIARYADWYNAKYGKISVKKFAKPRIAHSLHGKVYAAAVTPGKANDSPHLMAMIAMMPNGSGHVPADAQYGGMENCQAVRDSGRRRIIEPKSGYEIKGFNARADMLRFFEKHPGTFHKLLRKRNNVESVFSSMRERFGGVVRAVKTNAQTVELLSTCTYHNMTFT